jgi:hypothetical protein
MVFLRDMVPAGRVAIVQALLAVQTHATPHLVKEVLEKYGFVVRRPLNTFARHQHDDAPAIRGQVKGSQAHNGIQQAFLRL